MHRRARMMLVSLVAMGLVVAFAAAGGPGAAAPASAAPPLRLFATSDQCFACHNGMSSAAGEDLSIGFAWRASIMANAARDPYWQAAVRREVTDRPAATAQIEDECAACHMPMARFEAHAVGARGQIFSHLGAAGPGGRAETDRAAQDGVSCSLCHQLQNAGPALQHDGEFVIDLSRPWGDRRVFGQYDIPRERLRIMQSASSFVPERAQNLDQSALCSTCHTLYTAALGPGGENLGRFPEQVPYLEWRHSAHAREKTCQACHMTFVREPVPASSVLGEPRPGFARHGFQGANFFMLGMLNRYRDELGVIALPEELNVSRLRTLELLRNETATVAVPRAEVVNGQLVIEVVVTNLAGHKVPTAYPSRRAWLHVEVRDKAGKVLFSSGGLRTDGSIDGNDNDRDPRAFEPHHEIIERAEDVQIYESIMLDAQGQVTTGLLSAVRYAKDNRLLPRGFDKTTAPEDCAVQGTARDDADFVGGGDRVVYRPRLPPDAAGPFEVEVELLYQPIAFRWAHNLVDYRSAAEPARFVRYYDAMSSGSATPLARAVVTTAR